MPSFLHEMIVELFRRRPQLGPELAVLSAMAHPTLETAEAAGASPRSAVSSRLGSAGCPKCASSSS